MKLHVSHLLAFSSLATATAVASSTNEETPPSTLRSETLTLSVATKGTRAASTSTEKSSSSVRGVTGAGGTSPISAYPGRVDLLTGEDVTEVFLEEPGLDDEVSFQALTSELEAGEQQEKSIVLHSANNLARMLASDKEKKFRKKHGLKEGVNLKLQTMGKGLGKGKKSVLKGPKGESYDVDSYEPHTVFSSASTCFHDGRPEKCPKSNISRGVSPDGSSVVLVSRDPESGAVDTLMVVGRDGVTKAQIVLLDPEFGIYDTIEEGDYDEEYLAQFEFGEQENSGGQYLDMTAITIDENDIPKGEAVEKNTTKPPQVSIVDNKLQDKGNKKLGRGAPSSAGKAFINLRGRELQSDPCQTWSIVQMAIAYDSTFCTDLGSKANADAKVQAIIDAASAKYEQEGLCVQLILEYLEGYCDPTTDVYKLARDTNLSGCGGGGILDEFNAYWQANRQAVTRDAAHLFVGGAVFDDAPTVGCAGKPGWCTSNGYGINRITFSTNLNSQTVLFAHELGHNGGADHDEGTPYTTIMAPAVNSSPDGFSSLSIASMRATIDGNTCIQEVPAVCSTDTECDDGDFCNGLETCDSGSKVCVRGAPVVCDDEIFCNGQEMCDPSSGQCSSSTTSNFCDDGNFCNGQETCDETNAVCVQGTPACTEIILATPSSGTRTGPRGYFFDLTGTGKIVRVTSIKVETYAAGTLQVYTRSGSGNGYTSSMNGWTQLVTDMSVSASSTVEISFDPFVEITDGSTVSFYVYNSGGLLGAYYGPDAPIRTPWAAWTDVSTTDLTLSYGLSNYSPFSSSSYQYDLKGLAITYREGPQPCNNNATCNDGDQCNGVETCNLSNECEAGTPPATCCGNGICEVSAGELAAFCPEDCCGDGVCDAGETLVACPADCSPVRSLPEDFQFTSEGSSTNFPFRQFEVVAKRDITVKSFVLDVFTTNDVTVEIYKGFYEERLQQVTVTGKGEGNPTDLPDLDDPFQLSADTTQEFMIEMTSGDSFSADSPSGLVFATNDDIDLQTGLKGYWASTTQVSFTGYINWHGQVKYSIEATSTEEPTFSPSQSPMTEEPTSSPSKAPVTEEPSSSPSKAPSRSPVTSEPSSSPSTSPSDSPSKAPTTKSPTSQPSASPSDSPSKAPATKSPTSQPSALPSDSPSKAPTTKSPTSQPSASPSDSPSKAPTTISPTSQPSASPSDSPSKAPTTISPTSQPSASPSDHPSKAPMTVSPTSRPSSSPSDSPTNAPMTDSPTNQPSSSPTYSPAHPPMTDSPTSHPSASPSESPSSSPSKSPSRSPITSDPSSSPSKAPVTEEPSAGPSSSPSRSPSGSPSQCSQPTDCDDAKYCNGVELCEGGVCKAGNPVNCDDGVNCTVDTCNEDTKSCGSVPSDIQCPDDNDSFCDGIQICNATTGCEASTPCSFGEICMEATDTCETAAPTNAPSEDPSSRPSDGPTASPTSQPSASPSGSPSKAPATKSPTSQPSASPSDSPSKAPATKSPTTQPSASPSDSPSKAPTTKSPTTQPSASPSDSPSKAPVTVSPTSQPSSSPSDSPSKAPMTDSPTNQPSSSPSDSPSKAPMTDSPTNQPSSSPTYSPAHPPMTDSPTSQPSALPSQSPSSSPSKSPSRSPVTSDPSSSPSKTPTTEEPIAGPSSSPSRSPSGSPSQCSQPTHCDDGLFCNGVEMCVNGTCASGTEVNCDDMSSCTIDSCNETSVTCDNVPSCSAGEICVDASCVLEPSSTPSSSPSRTPSRSPLTDAPSLVPSKSPSRSPITDEPSSSPSKSPTTSEPSSSPSKAPSRSPVTSEPSSSPSKAPATEEPSSGPTSSPSEDPSSRPSDGPTDSPTVQHSASPSGSPSKAPVTDSPTSQPSLSPSGSPSKAPETDSPTSQPSASPSDSPSKAPMTRSPTNQPSASPSVSPSKAPLTVSPTNQPSASPSDSPSKAPVTNSPTNQPSASPSDSPSKAPVTNSPTNQPSASPSNSPTKDPTTDEPSSSPSDSPTNGPTSSPSKAPITSEPSSSPSKAPSRAPITAEPSSSPSDTPSRSPVTDEPSSLPTNVPSLVPTVAPTDEPSRVPSAGPTLLGSSSPSRSPVPTANITESSIVAALLSPPMIDLRVANSQRVRRAQETTTVSEVLVQVDLEGITESEVMVRRWCDNGEAKPLSDFNPQGNSSPKIFRAPEFTGAYKLCFNDKPAPFTIFAYDSSRATIDGYGRIDSAAGSVVSDATMEFQARFSFAAKYKRRSVNEQGDRIPSGNVEFISQDGDNFEFHSDSLSALVVVGRKAKLFGTGSVNAGVKGSVYFCLTVEKGPMRGIRLQIWDDEGEGGELVYDNYAPSDEGGTCGADCFSTQPLISGKITKIQGATRGRVGGDGPGTTRGNSDDESESDEDISDDESESDEDNSDDGEEGGSTNNRNGKKNDKNKGGGAGKPGKRKGNK